MSIDTAIEKMEETLAKKKALRVKIDKSRLVSLQERVKTKTEKFEKLLSEVGSLNTEIEHLETRIAAEGETKEAEFTKTPPAKKK